MDNATLPPEGSADQAPPKAENMVDKAGRCTCGLIHMASHNAFCRHCAEKFAGPADRTDDKKGPSR
ncbi:MAG TPA: hypothetical protein PKA10_09620 [Selenomonadales bacterium]|nr:hypothetical protein [Selenomonadales bacterium]